MYQCKDLLQKITYQCIRGKEDVSVSEVVYDSRKITKNCYNFCE